MPPHINNSQPRPPHRTVTFLPQASPHPLPLPQGFSLTYCTTLPELLRSKILPSSFSSPFFTHPISKSAFDLNGGTSSISKNKSLIQLFSIIATNTTLVYTVVSSCLFYFNSSELVSLFPLFLFPVDVQCSNQNNLSNNA